jgi:hypothetical protein
VENVILSPHVWVAWLIVLVAVVVLWRVRGTRALMLLLGCLLLLVIAVTVWNVIVSAGA